MRRWWLGVALALGWAGFLAAQSTPVRSAAEAIDSLRGFAFQYDDAMGATAAAEWGRRFPRIEIDAWRAYFLVRNGRSAEAMMLAESLVRRAPTSRWALLARASALGFGPKRYTDRDGLLGPALRLSPWVGRDSAVTFVFGELLLSLYWPREVASALAAARDTTPLGLALLSEATSQLSYFRGSPETQSRLRDSTLALVRKAQTRDPRSVPVWRSAALRLLEAGKAGDALAPSRHVVELAPLSPKVVEVLVRVSFATKDPNGDSVKAELRSVVERIRIARGKDPNVLAWCADRIRELGSELDASAMEDTVLASAPRSEAAEQVLMSRIRRLGKLVADSLTRTSGLREKYRQALGTFVARQQPKLPHLVGEAFVALLTSADSAVSGDSIARWAVAAQRLAGPSGGNVLLRYARPAVELADRRTRLDLAARFARDGVVAAERELATQRDYFDVGAFDTERNFYLAIMGDALGWTYAQAGRRADGIHELRRAIDIQPRYTDTYYHLGRVFEQMGRTDSAEVWFTKGSLVPALPGMQNLSRATLRRLYVARHGSMEGYQAYFDQLAAADRTHRHDVIARELNQSRVPLPAFRLTALDGRIVASDSLLGHPLVINVWGKWCGPCVAEMGDIQKFATRYASDSAVRVVTIDNDRDVDELRAWLKQHGYDFPVLIDDGYVAQHVRIWPTTFFVDRLGRIASVKTGWSEALVEEFGWRVEILKGEGKTTP